MELLEEMETNCNPTQLVIQESSVFACYEYGDLSEGNVSQNFEKRGLLNFSIVSMEFKPKVSYHTRVEQILAEVDDFETKYGILTSIESREGISGRESNTSISASDSPK